MCPIVLTVTAGNREQKPLTDTTRLLYKQAWRCVFILILSKKVVALTTALFALTFHKIAYFLSSLFNNVHGIVACLGHVEASIVSLQVMDKLNANTKLQCSIGLVNDDFITYAATFLCVNDTGFFHRNQVGYNFMCSFEPCEC